ncbi:hypothetical protein HMPREF1173_01798 [Prevotella nigrescens CC14M]|uniref:Uncharacterized protein n=1 Tax=Prevotella nigrescens CC14M TaxID=1073366 RepID=V8CM56_9BACT|nr:hypothetical protein HMPREF0662_02547 [Prevotella nigrescens F0103]ETD28197.1 hypothetical protein HMPREF1173_01798 [Prevotella nigrescens CC14M]
MISQVPCKKEAAIPMDLETIRCFHIESLTT